VRAARAGDFRRRLRERANEWPFRLNEFSFVGVPSLGEGDLQFLSPLTVISGPNGVGKTTLLRAIWATARADDAISTAITAQKLPSGSCTLSFMFNGLVRTSDVVFTAGRPNGGTDLGVDVVHLDSASEVVSQQIYFSGFGNIEDLINGVLPKALDGGTLETINYPARRELKCTKWKSVRDG
jgi:hypothetical protein